MTDEEKKNNLNFYIHGGYLKTRTYKEAWQNAWANATKEDKEKLFKLPNFDSKVFEDLSGINLEEDNPCAGKIVTIDGKKYRLEETD